MFLILDHYHPRICIHDDVTDHIRRIAVIDADGNAARSQDGAVDEIPFGSGRAEDRHGLPRAEADLHEPHCDGLNPLSISPPGNFQPPAVRLEPVGGPVSQLLHPISKHRSQRLVLHGIFLLEGRG